MIRKKHKILSILISSVMFIGSLSACSNNDTTTEYGLDANNPTVIKIWHYYNGVQQANFDNMINEFNETVGYEKGIIVEASSMASINELSEKVLASLNNEVGSEEPPNIFAAYAETAYAVDKLGYASDIKQYFTEDELAEYVPNYIEEGEFSDDGSLKIFPMAKSTEVMILNATDWQSFADATGVTTDDLKTWEGLAEVSEKYYNYTDDLTPDVPNDGKSFFGRDSSANYMVVGAKQLGYEYITVEDGKNTINIDETALRKLWDNYYVPYVKGYYGSQSRFRSDDAKIGKIIALIGSTTGSAYYPTSVTIDDDYSYPIESLVLPVPNFEDCDPYIVQQGAGFVVTKADEKIEYACSIFLKWYTETDRNIESTISSGYLPVKTEALDFSKITSINEQSENKIDGVLLSTIEVAIDELSTYEPYTTKPYDNCAEVRDFLEEAIHTQAVANYEEVCTRISNGENRDDVLNDYVSDEAFDIWLDYFKTNLESIAYAE
ncbi:MAG: extracellular solute-binding protein [Ruminococcus sp.]|nr:extracellular solute-binding protein [Ruminococcus sp.]